MLPLAHDLDSQRTQHNLVDQARHSDSSHGQQCIKPVLRGDKSRKTQRASTFAGSQGYCHGQGSLQGEIDGEDGRLQTGELRARQGAEGHDATDKGLESC